MINKILLFLILSLFLPSVVSAQTLEPTNIATVSPQIRNTLQLLENPAQTDVRLQALDKHFAAILNRLKNINTRIESRLSKTSIPNNNLAKLNSQFKKIADDLNKLDKDKLTMADFIKALEAILNDQKNLVGSMKKFAPKVEPKS